MTALGSSSATVETIAQTVVNELSRNPVSQFAHFVHNEVT
jgi:hypothetical protein